MHTTHWIAVFGLIGFLGCADLSDDIETTASAVTSGDFSLSASPTAQTIHRGGTAIYQIHVAALNGFTGTVTLTVSGIPNHDSAFFTDTSGNFVFPATVTDSGDLLLHVHSAGHQSPLGTSRITITGTSGNLINTVQVMHTVIM
jgi:hypothetical protein